MYKSEGERGYYNVQLRARQKLQYLLKKNMLAEKYLFHPKKGHFHGSRGNVNYHFYIQSKISSVPVSPNATIMKTYF